MFVPAFFGLGTQELILLFLLGGGAVGIFLLVKFLSATGGGRSEALEEENRRLRDENDRLRGDR